jgi:nucleotidyltransferase/DNA polymerase involved in DNA repair
VKSELQKIPGVGKSIAQDLILLGYNSISDLQGADPKLMYDYMCKITNSKQDR